MKIAFLLINYNSSQDTIGIIDKLISSGVNKDNIFLLDNFSTDTELETIQNIESLPINNVFTSSLNLGYSGGYNYLVNRIDYNHYDGLIFLNSDLIINKNILNTILAQLKNKDIQGYNIYNTRNKKGFISESILCAYLGCRFFDKFFSIFADSRRYDGALFFISTPLFKKILLNYGEMFDHQLFMYCDEIDISHKINSLGYKIDFQENICISHKQGSSINGNRSNFIRYFAFRNRLYLSNKWYPWFMSMPLNFMICLRFFPSFLISNSLRIFLKAYFDYKSSRMGPM